MKNSKEKGVTLVALVTTIVLLMILASMGTYAGRTAIQSAKFSQFKNELKVMQAKVDELNQNNKTEIGTKTLTQEQKNIITENVSNADENFINGFRYCDSSYIKENFGLESINRDYLINVEYRYVISTEPVENNGNTYYMIYQMEDGIYNVQYNDKNPKTGDFQYRISDDTNWKTSNGLSFYVIEEGSYYVQLVYDDIVLGPKSVIALSETEETEINENEM